ncbi:MAG: arylsulfatase [Akkermansiaceae bacterium]
MKLLSLFLSSLFSIHSLAAAPPAADGVSTQSEGGGQALKPNVIIIMTDDQGYGDLACHGNPVIRTPHLDQLHAESIRLTNFHVSPFCTPTRAALMTGRYPARTGAYRTSSGRSNLHHDEITIAQYFARAGYRTGMVGKWHLGDNAPCRPQDKGFQDVVWHKCGGIGQASDYYGNDYFDDTYERHRDGTTTLEAFKGYCTDVFFRESMRFIEDNKDKPFLLYLATNAPHSPYVVEESWAAPYRDTIKWNYGPEFYGMITNFDHNLGLLRKKLEEIKLNDNTILVFLTDNGTAKGNGGKGAEEGDFRGFNAGMRGQKSTIFEGGHRVPFFIHHPAGGIKGGQDRAQLGAHIDILPTLAELCRVPTGKTLLDGRSFVPVLKDASAPACRDHVVIQHHGGPWMQAEPRPLAFSNVIKGPWRLHNGEVLYNVGDAHWEGANVAKGHPEVVAELLALYDAFWKSVSSRMTPVCLDLGNPAENPTTLCSQDWYFAVGNPPWNFGEINQLKKVTGPWHVNVKQAGRYRLTLRQFPKEAGKPLKAVKAKIAIAGLEREAPVEKGAKSAVFELNLPAGETTLTTWLTNAKGETGGAYFTEVKLLETDE